jgi:hypothetical protein
MTRAWFAILAVVVACSAWIDVLVLRGVMRGWPEFPTDFVTFWTAGKVPWPTVYDVAELTRLQMWAGFKETAIRPFAYPPTFLFLLNPLGRLQLLPALLIWLSVGISLYALACWRLIGKAWPLALLSPAVACAAATGQVTFLVGAGLIMGVLWLPARPILAGVVFGALATVKPQAVVLVPLALVVGRHWRAGGASLVSGALIGLASLAVHKGLWVEWLGSLSEFNAIIEGEWWVATIGVTPKIAAKALGLGGAWQLAFLVAGAVSAVLLVVMAFRKDDPIMRYGALSAGFLLISPYALWYELAMLQPVAASFLLSRSWPQRGAGLVVYSLFAKWAAPMALAAALAGRGFRKETTEFLN